jgi:GH24 family phage-related lysozyme (muramidase)
MTPDPGIHHNIPYADYHAIPRINASRLVNYIPSARYGRYMDQQPKEDTSSLTKGHASHTALLEPHLYSDLYAVMPRFEGHPNSNDYKAQKAAWIAAHGSFAPLTAQEDETAKAIAANVMRHPLAASLINGRGANEVTLIGQIEGVDAKGRIDRVTTWTDPEGQTWPVIVDLKTTRTAPDHFLLSRELTKWHYHVKAAWYVDLMAAIKGVEMRFVYIFAQTEAEQDVVVKMLGEDSIEQGRSEYKKALKRLLAAEQTGIYPGRSNVMETIDIPSYAIEQEIE